MHSSTPLPSPSPLGRYGNGPAAEAALDVRLPAALYPAPAGPIEVLRERIRSRTARVGVVGLGYAGLPLAVAFANQLKVAGIDADAAKVFALGRGESPIADVPDGQLQSVIRPDGLVPTTSFVVTADCDVIFVCVPTPVGPSKDPDLSFIEAAVRGVLAHLRPGQLVVLESTTYPGTTDEFVLPLLESTGLVLDRDFLLAFSSERVDPGNHQQQWREIPKVVGGCTPLSTIVASDIYRLIFDDVQPVSSAGVAEMSKLLENAFRFVNIGLVNEVAELCDHLGIDAHEVIAAASTKPFGFMPFWPGPGVGGHCIPIDPLYLAWLARRHGLESKLVSAADEVNEAMPLRVAAKVAVALADRDIDVAAARILILGVAYKENISDTRNSPALALMGLLRDRGAQVRYHDPFVPVLKAASGQGPEPMTSVELSIEEIAHADCVVVVAGHDLVPYDRILSQPGIVLDTRGRITSAQAARAVATVVRL